jgi:hypothetical protein
MKRFKYMAFTVFVVSSVAIYFILFKKPSIVFVVSEDFRGWVQLYWNIPSAKPLPKWKGGFLVKVKDSGIIHTSTKSEEASTDLEFYVEDKNGEWKPLNYYEYKGKDDPVNTLYFCGSGTAVRGTIEFEHFFVGTYEECLQLNENPFLPDSLQGNSQ